MNGNEINGKSGDVCMSKTYVIDACSLINIAHNYNMGKKAFAGIWDLLY